MLQEPKRAPVAENMDTTTHSSNATKHAIEFASVLGSLLFVFLLIARISQGLNGSLISWFLAAESWVVAARLVFRRKQTKDSPAAIRLIAWLSAALPMMMETSGSLLPTIPGILLSIWSLFALGDSFGVAPSNRGLVELGPYRFIRHPMYAGELLSLLGLCLFSPAILNWVVFAVFGVTVYIRIIEEETLIDGYYWYTRRVAWRLIPFIW